ncbi:MAG TPA: DoxX family protein [Alphaproteobacteria bacterium]
MAIDQVCPNLMFPALRPFYERVAPYIYPLVRFTAGALIIPHGYTKVTAGVAAVAANVLARRGIEPALPLAYAIIFLETVGGACVALGLLTRVFAAMIAVEFAIITFVAHWPSGFSWTAGGYEFPMMWGIVFFIIAIRGGGHLSIDRNVIGREI